MTAMRKRLQPLVLVLVAACTPDVGTDTTPEELQFDPNSKPPRVSEPSLVVLNRSTGRIDLSLAGIEVPMDCASQPAATRASCEFNQYLQSLDGFPTSAGARTPVSAPVDMATATVPGNVSVVEAKSLQAFSDVTVGYDGPSRYLQIKPRKSWPAGGFVWIGIRGYDNGLRADGKPVVASVVYNLLKRDDTLTCKTVQSPAEIEDSCPYLALLSQQMSAEAARATLVRLEALRVVLASLQGWQLMDTVGGIPKAEAAMLWAFPIHSAPVIDLNPVAGLQPQVVAADEIRLAVNGEVDPATVTAFRAFAQPGTVYLINLSALAQMSPTAFPAVTASYADGAITIKGAQPFVSGMTYGIFVTKGVKNAGGKSMVAPPLSVLLMAQGPLLGDDGKSTVSSISDLEATLLEAGRRQLAPLFENSLFVATTGITREQLAYLYAFPLSAP
jgi:hypothetical protein